MADLTQLQDADDQHRAQVLSTRGTRPPLELPGYEIQRYLGSGAFGEVWVALDRTTGRQVAIKFYAHRGGLDWSLLSREVEKLAFLSADRYVVQLLDVGWDANPPYYVMEYLEAGSLDDHLDARGKLPVHEAVRIFRDVAIGLLHAHAKGVLHCDLKPANVLLDQDQKPRLADFGQSRLSHEQTPALGTLFYMAPEQADLQAMPDARWDVYALGALLYCMLTGAPPHRDAESTSELETEADLDARLARYRQRLVSSPAATAHRQVRGVDRRLAEIVDRCLAIDPARRYPNVQAVLSALDDRARRRARRPLMVLGAIGPALLLLLMSLMAWRWFSVAVSQSNDALIERALQTNRFAASHAALIAADELERRYRAVEQLAENPTFQDMMLRLLNNPDLQPLVGPLSDPELSEAELEPLRARYRQHPAVVAFREQLMYLTAEEHLPDVHSWFVNDARGLQLARAPSSQTEGVNWAWRPYFHGGGAKLDEKARPAPVTETSLSPAYISRASDRWVVAVTTPIVRRGSVAMGAKERVLGVLSLSFEVRKRFVAMADRDDHFAVLLQRRSSTDKSLVLQHPLFEKLIAKEGEIPERFKKYRIAPEDLPRDDDGAEWYRDPLATDQAGEYYARRWLAAQQPVRVRGRDTGWIVVVQESYDAAIGSVLTGLKDSLLQSGLITLAGLIATLTVLGFVVVRAMNNTTGERTFLAGK